jgi:hypothetical protein
MGLLFMMFVVADVVDLEAAGAGIAQQHVAAVAVEEVAEAGKLPIGPHLSQRIRGQNRIIADVIDLVKAAGRRIVQNHVRAGGVGGRSVRSGGSRRHNRSSEEERIDRERDRACTVGQMEFVLA